MKATIMIQALKLTPMFARIFNNLLYIKNEEKRTSMFTHEGLYD